MQQLPDIRVWRTANEYQEAASLCDENGKNWAGAILAALAVEIYLKSFLSEEIAVEFLGEISQIFKKTEQGHDLEKLFNKIPQKMKEIMIKESDLLIPKIDLQQIIIKNKDIFTMARYYHEQNSIDCLSNEIIRLSEHMRELVIKVAGYTHHDNSIMGFDFQ